MGIGGIYSTNFMFLLALYFFLCILRDASNSLSGIKTLLHPILTNLTEAIAPVLGPQVNHIQSLTQFDASFGPLFLPLYIEGCLKFTHWN
jgi:hypothetical protein